MTAISIAKDLLRAHEGLRLRVYKCTSGKNTIGYGRNLDDKGISQNEAESMLSADVADCVADLESFPYWASLTDSRKAALIDLRFNLGPVGFRKFKEMNAALEQGNYHLAANELLDSTYANQVGQRAHSLAEILITGDG
jgi:lysozyme